MNQTKAKPKIQRLRNRLKAYGISQQAVAAAAGVSPVHVCNVLAGRDKSQKVLDTVNRLLADPPNGAGTPAGDGSTRGVLETGEVPRA